MNTLVEMLNVWGGRFMDAAWPMLWQSGVLIAVVFALDLALRKRVRATTRYALWLLVLAKLVVPTSLSLPTGIAYWLPAPKPVVTSSLWLDNNRRAAPTLQPPPALGAGQTLHSEAARQRGPTDEPPALSSPQTQQPDAAPSTKSTQSTTSTAASSLPLDNNRRTAPTLHWRGVAVLSWLAGMAALSGVLAFRARLTRRMVAAATGTEQFSGLLAQCASRLGMQGRVSACSVGAPRRFPGRVTLKLSSTAATPAVCGLFHPVILLPMALAARLSAAQLEAVLLHELAHVRRGDPWVNYAQALLQIFYFYNPLLWLANAAIRRAREEAVDELVLVALADEAPLYPETLLQVAKFSMQTPRPGFGWVGILEKKSTVGGRIRLMLHRPWPKSARLDIRGGLAVLALAAVLLPMKSRPQQQNPPPSVASNQRRDPAPAASLSPESLAEVPPLIPPASFTNGEAQLHEFMQKHQSEIARACDAAMTNILHELQGLAKQYPALSDIGATSIEKGGDPDSCDNCLTYSKNARIVDVTAGRGVWPGPLIRDNPGQVPAQLLPDMDGAVLRIVIHKKPDDQQFKDMAIHLYPVLLDETHEKIYADYTFRLDPSDPALGKAVKDIVEKQVGILRKTLQQIIANEPAPQRAQTSVSAPSASPLSATNHPDVCAVEIQADGGYWLDGKKLPLAQVEAELVRMFHENPKLSVDIRADQRARFHNVVELAEACESNHIPLIALHAAAGDPSSSTNAVNIPQLDILQRHQTEIAQACDVAMTNILRDLQALAQQYPPLSDIGSASIAKAPLADSLDYLKNARYVMPPPGLQTGHFEIEKEGAVLLVHIQKEDDGATYMMYNTITMYALLLAGGRDQVFLRYDFQLNSPDPALEKAIKDIVEKQVGILRNTFRLILGTD